MSFIVTIPARSIKMFSKILLCLSRIGDELYLECRSEGLILRALNNARSAFIAFNLKRHFFEKYTLNEKVSPCKIQIRPCLSVFKNTLSVENCVLSVDTSENRIVFSLLCRMAIKKVYKLTYEECEVLQARYDKNACTNCIVSRAKLLSESVQNFSTNQEEITLIASKKMLRFRSYVDDMKPGTARPLQTEMTFAPNDFEGFTICDTADIREIELTFCLKELKALLLFGEFSEQPISFSFDRGGRPLLVSINCYGQVEVEFVLATLIESSNSQSNSSNNSQTTPTSTPTSYQTNENNSQTSKRNSVHYNSGQMDMMDQEEGQEMDQRDKGTGVGIGVNGFQNREGEDEEMFNSTNTNANSKTITNRPVLKKEPQTSPNSKSSTASTSFYQSSPPSSFSTTTTTTTTTNVNNRNSHSGVKTTSASNLMKQFLFTSELSNTPDEGMEEDEEFVPCSQDI